MNKPGLSPFPVDPEVRSRIRSMNAGDAKAVAAMHASMMGNSLWGKLGESFLEQVYLALCDHPSFLAYVYEEDGRIGGFIAGTDNGPKMMKEVFQKRAGTLATAALTGLLHRPSAALPLLGTVFYFRKSALPGLDGVTAESMFCAFHRELRGKRISGLINKVLFEELAARGHRYVKITTEKDNEGARRQLVSWGFESMGSFRFYGKEMTAWRLDIQSCERVDLPSDGQ